MRRIIWAACLWMALAGLAAGEARPLVSGAVSPLMAAALGGGRSASASLFPGRGDGGLFAPQPTRTPPLRATDDQVALLLSLIAQAEAGGAHYDAVQHGAHIPPPRPPTEMTLGGISDWITATPGQPHAIGRYQFIPPTLHRVAQARGFGPETRFDADVQDALAMVLLEEAGLTEFLNGEVDRRGFMGRLARIWAGLPLPDGRSYYHGYAGNRAAMSWPAFEAGMARIWPLG